MTYLTPDERETYKWLSNLDKVDDLLASHAALDEMAREMREALLCVNFGTGASDPKCPCYPCIAAREYDEMIGNAHTGSDERAHEGTCPKHVGCLPEPCGDCPDEKRHLFAKRFPEKVGHIETHYPECYKSHPSCAWRVGWSDGIEHVVWMLRNTEGPMTSEGIYTGPSSGTLDALAEWIEGMT